MRIAVCAVFALATAAAESADPTYVLSGTIVLGGNGGCAGIACDAQHQRLFLSRGDRVEILATTGMPLGAIPAGPDLGAPVLVGNRAFFANGSGPLQVVDTAARRNLGGVTLSGPMSGPVTYAVADPGGQVYAALHDAHALVTIAPDIVPGPAAGMPLGHPPYASDIRPGGAPGPAIGLGGAPGQLAADGHGHVYAILDDTDAIAVVATAGATVSATWPCPGHHPVSLACDGSGTRLMIACADRHLLILDTATGAVGGDLAIAQDPGDCAWSGGAFLVISPAGSLTVLRQSGPGGYAVAQTVAIPRGASHLAVDGLGVVFVPSELYPTSGDTTQPVAGGFRLMMIARLPALEGGP